MDEFAESGMTTPASLARGVRMTNVSVCVCMCLCDQQTLDVAVKDPDVGEIRVSIKHHIVINQAPTGRTAETQTLYKTFKDFFVQFSTCH